MIKLFKNRKLFKNCQFFKNKALALLSIFFIILYLLPLNQRLLWQADETRYAEISREMLQRGDWIVPRLLDVRYFEKPVAGYWINNLSQWLWGENNFAVRFGSAFSIALTALLVFWLATRLWHNRSTAILATLIYLTFFLVFGVGSYAVLDPMISLWLMAAMVSFHLTSSAIPTALEIAARRPGGETDERRQLRDSANARSQQRGSFKGEGYKTSWQKIGAYALLGIACAMGVMTKGFLALVVPVIAIVPIVLLQKRVKELLFFGPIAVLAALLSCLPWALTIAQREPDFWHYFFWIEHIQRFATEDAQHKEPFWYYLPLLCLGVLPWLGLLPGALLKGWRERVNRPELFFLLSWVLMPLIFFSIAQGKLLTYILPCMAPLALLMTAYATDCVNSQQMNAFKMNGIINLILGILCTLTVLILGMDYFPQWILLNQDENNKILLGMLAFATWAVLGWWSLRANHRHWKVAAACPLLLATLVGYIIPQHIIDVKQPQHFIRQNSALLQESRYLLTNEVGIATGLAWELKRNDVMMFNSKGELSYGLNYPDSRDHYVNKLDFPTWLTQARQQGNVVLVLLDNQKAIDDLPHADKIEQFNRLLLLSWLAKTDTPTMNTTSP
ncbi:4-amino-4-deoxy-L-arabinose lipid A transferase [Candidatus Regiella insecticola]|nr:4-amino-4-deoxy-L-arabinose lipid A transferase [Candidatus Regiella insecticola]